MPTNMNDLSAAEAFAIYEGKKEEPAAGKDSPVIAAPEVDRSLSPEEAFSRAESAALPPNAFMMIGDNKSDTMKRALLSDPLALIPREDRPKIASYLNVLPDGEAEFSEAVMKNVAARWYSNQYKIPLGTAVQGFDAITKQVFGKEMSGSEVYMNLRALRQREEDASWGRRGERAGRGLVAGVLDVEKGLNDAVAMGVDGVYSIGAVVNMGVFAPVEWLARKFGADRVADRAGQLNWMNQDANQDRSNPFEIARNFLYERSDALRREIEYQEQAGGESTGFGEDVAVGIIRNLPNVLMTVMLAEAQAGRLAGQAQKGMSWASAYFGASGAATELADTRNDENMTMSGRVMNACIVGGAEAFFEEWTGAGRIVRKYWLTQLPKQEIKRVSEGVGRAAVRAAKSLGIDAAGEGWEEVETGVVQRVSNLLFGKDGKSIASMSAMEIAHEILDPVPLEFSVGAGSGGLMSMGGVHHRYRNQLYDARMLNFRADMIGAAKADLAQLEGLENPTADQKSRMDFLRTAIAEQNADGITDFAAKQLREHLAANEQQRADDEMSNQDFFAREGREGLSDARELQSLERKVDAPSRYSAVQTVMLDAVRDLKLGPVEINLVDQIADLPADLQGEANAEGVFNPADGKVYLIAENLTAGRVKEVILHEVVGHRGLKGLFGEKYDAFLDRIADDYADEVAAVAARRGFDTTIPAKRLEAADEFLAELAEGGERKQGVVKRVLARLRQWLRDLGWNSGYTDDDLVYLLNRSASATRAGKMRDWQGGEARFFARNRQGEALFNFGEFGSLTIAEVIEDDGILNNQPVLTDSGKEEWGRITEAMIAKAAPELGLKSLPIKLFKGDIGYGLVHIGKHLADYPGVDLAGMMEKVFGKPNKIYAKKELKTSRGGNTYEVIKLEVFPKPPASWGILELREERDCYAVVTFYPRNNQYSKPKGELIWEYGSQSVSSSAASEQSKPGLADKPLAIREELTAKSDENINPFGLDVKPDSEKNSGIRNSVHLDEGKLKAWTRSLMPLANTHYINPDAAAAYLANNGIAVDPVRDEAMLRAACIGARDAKRERNRKIREKAEAKELAKQDDFYRVLSEKYGPGFKIAAGAKYEGAAFTGSWMDPRKTEKGRKGSLPAEEAAKVLTQALGKEVSAAAVVEHFGHLKRESLLADYRSKRREQSERREFEAEISEEERMAATGDEYAGDRPMPKESEAMKKARERYIRDRAKAEQSGMNKWVDENMGELYQQVIEFCGSDPVIRPSGRFDGEAFTGSFISKAWRSYGENRPGRKTGRALLDYNEKRRTALENADGMNSDELASAIARKYGGDALEIEQSIIDLFRDLKRSDLKSMYREAKREERQRTLEENKEGDAFAAAERFEELLRMAEADKVNIIRFQQQAATYASRVLPEAMRGHFLRQIADLAKWESEPSPAYPEGRRAREMAKLLTAMQSFRAAERIRELLDGTKLRVNKSGIPISALGENAETIGRIREIVKLQVFDVENTMIDLREKIVKAEAAEDTMEADRLREELALFDLFGRLDRKSPEESMISLRALRNLIDGDRESLLNRLREKRLENGKLQHQAAVEVTGSKDGVPVTGKLTKEPKQPWKFSLEQRNLRNLLSFITSRSDKEFDKTVFGGLFKKIESSTQRGATLDRESQQRAEAKIEEIFGLDSFLKKKAFWHEVEAVPEKTGIMIDRYSREITYFAENDGSAGFGVENKRGFERATITVKSARKLLADIDAGKAELDPMAVSFLRQQVSDFDLGIEREYRLFGNDDENGAWKILTENKDGKKTGEELEATTKLLVIKPDPAAKKTTTELLVSRAEAANILMAWEQDEVQMRMRWNGWSDASIEQLKKYIGDDMIRWAEWARQEIADQSELLDGAARRTYGAGLPRIKNYFPTSYKESLDKQLGSGASDGVVGDSYGRLSINPSFLIARKFHLSEPDFHQSIFQNFFRHQLETNHFLAFGETIRDFRSIFNNKQVAQSIRQTFGTEVYNQIKDRVQVISDAGRDTGRAGQILGKLFRYWVPGKIALNTSSVAKQIAGVVNYMNDMPMVDFLANFSESFTGSERFRRFAEYALASDYFKNRMAGGLNRDLLYLMQSTRSGKVEDIFGNYLIDKGTRPTRWADSVASLRGGFAVFQYHFDQAVKRGMDDAAAWDHAAERWQRSTDETQQSGYLKDQNYFQSQAGLYRYFTAFLSNPVQMMNLELMTFDEMRFGTGKRAEAARAKLARQLFINHVVCPFLMTAVTQFFRHGADWEEYEFSDFLTAFALGPFEGWFIAGKIGAALGNEVLGSLEGKLRGRNQSGFGNASINAIPILDDSLLAWRRFLKTVDLEKPPGGAEVYGAMQGLADLLAAAGTVAPIPHAGALGAITGGALREGKRFYRLLFEDKKKKPTGYRGY